MKVLKKIFNYKTLLILLGILVITLLSSRFISFSASPEEIELAFSKTNFQPISHYEKFEEGDLHYITVGDSSKRSLMFSYQNPFFTKKN